MQCSYLHGKSLQRCRAKATHRIFAPDDTEGYNDYCETHLQEIIDEYHQKINEDWYGLPISDFGEFCDGKVLAPNEPEPKTELQEAWESIEDDQALEALRKEKVEKIYLENGWSRCPYPDCRSGDITGGFLEVDGKIVTQMCHCNDCDKSWQDQYTLSGVNLFDPVDKPIK